jgi:predicted Rossmann fold nucleotide-binding protein DprA/Smf involved in DNA uptake
LAAERCITIISGGQTGADRAALDFAIEHGIPHGGWCPRGRLAEDGTIPLRYELRETPSRKYAQRTEWNIRDSDGTLVFSIAAEPQGGTRLTLEFAKRLGKPVLHLSRDSSKASAIELATDVEAFLSEHSIETLNIAGPRASQDPEVGAFVRSVLQSVFDPARIKAD